MNIRIHFFLVLIVSTALGQSKPAKPLRDFMQQQPSLVVNVLKMGADASGAIGLWVDVGTEGFCFDLKLNKQN